MSIAEISQGDTGAARYGQVRVWDLFVRVFHWTLVLSITVAAVTGYLLGPSWLRLHIASASLAIALVVVRIVWGLLGPGPARFSSFVRAPAVLLHHLRELLDGRAPRHLGHNPLGGAMILALIGTILLLGLSGVMALGGALKSGPLAGWLPYLAGALSSELHSALAFGLMLLIGGHLAGVYFESRRTHENLAKAMVTGCKEARMNDALPPRRRAHPLLAALVSTLLLGGGFWALQALSQKPPANLPVAAAQFDPVVASECSDCHMLYNPALLPAQDWRKITATLDDHFGEDASLDPATTQHITDWLVAHAAESADIRAAHMFRIGDGQGVKRISETRAWKHKHEDLSAALFRRKSVGSPDNCQACHKDAQDGLFSPFQISIPKE